MWLLLAWIALLIFIIIPIVVVVLFAVFWPLRRKLFTMPFLNWVRRQQPSLTTIEQQVLESGGVWWEKNFFAGYIDWEQLLLLEKPVLTTVEQEFLDNQVETLCTMIDNWQIENELETLPEAVWNYIKKEGFWSLGLDKKYGGHNFSPIAHSAIISKIASRSYSAAVTIMVPNALGPAEFLQHYGTEEQKERYLPRLGAGDEISCFALTSPNAGSDAMSTTDTGIVCKGIYQNSEVLGIRLNWKKRYITLSPIATLIGLAFHLFDPDHLLGDQEDIGITLALIPSNTPGIKIGKRHKPLNLSFLNGPISGKDVFIPLDWIIGGVERRGHGWQMLMECLAVGRGISLPAVSTAITQLCFRMGSAYAYIRQQFRRSIGEFEGVKESLAHIGGFTYLSEATRLFTSLAVAKGARPAVASAISKYHLTEICRKVVNYTMDIHAGHGIQMGPRNYMAFLHMATPVNITVEGANILTRNLIIFGQGVMRCHPYLRAEIMAASDPNDPIKVRQFDRLLLKHIGMVLNQLFRAFIYGITNGCCVKVPKKKNLTKYFRQLTRMSVAFALVSNVTLAIVGGKLKFKESLSARLGDVLSYLYMSSAVIKHFHDEGEKEQDLVFVDWCLSYCLHQIRLVFGQIFDNFPIPWIAKLIQLFIFPWGGNYIYPKEQWNFDIADKMQRDLILRDSLSKNCYSNQSPSDATGRVELAFQKLLKVRPILAKIEEAIKQKKLKLQNNFIDVIETAYRIELLSAEEYHQLLEAETLRWNALAVDEF